MIDLSKLSFLEVCKTCKGKGTIPDWHDTWESNLNPAMEPPSNTCHYCMGIGLIL